MTRMILVASVAVLAMMAGACGDDGAGNPDTGRFPDLVVGADEAALVGRVVNQAGEGWAGLRVAACSDVDCPIIPADDEGYFVHDKLAPDKPRRFEVFGRYDEYGSVVFRREFTAGEAIDVGDIVVPAPTGSRAEWPADTGGTVVIAGGMLELTAGADEVIWPLGTVDFDVQAAVVAPDEIPPYYNQPWVGHEDGTIGFALIPFDLFATAPVKARVLTGVSAPAGSKFDVYEVNPLDGILTLAGTATVDGDGVLATDDDAHLRDLTFILFVPRD